MEGPWEGQLPPLDTPGDKHFLMYLTTAHAARAAVAKATNAYEELATNARQELRALAERHKMEMQVTTQKYKEEMRIKDKRYAELLATKAKETKQVVKVVEAPAKQAPTPVRKKVEEAPVSSSDSCGDSADELPDLQMPSKASPDVSVLREWLGVGGERDSALVQDKTYLLLRVNQLEKKLKKGVKDGEKKIKEQTQLVEKKDKELKAQAVEHEKELKGSLTLLSVEKSVSSHLLQERNELKVENMVPSKAMTVLKFRQGQTQLKLIKAVNEADQQAEELKHMVKGATEDEIAAAVREATQQVNASVKVLQMQMKMRSAWQKETIEVLKSERQRTEEYAREKEEELASRKAQFKKMDTVQSMAHLAEANYNVLQEMRQCEEDERKRVEAKAQEMKLADGQPMRGFIERALTHTLREQAGKRQENRNKFSMDGVHELRTGARVQAAQGIAALLGLTDDDLHRKMGKGATQIAVEINNHGTQEDRECLHYVLHRAAGDSEMLFPNSPWPRDCDRHGLRDDRVSTHPNRREPRQGMILDDFVNHPASRAAGLEKHHVLALRLYNTAAFKSINGPLRDLNLETPHPLAATVAFVYEAIKKLRVVDKEDRPLDLWRGMRNIEASQEFQESGGCELAVMSTTNDPAVAIRYGISQHSLIFKLNARSFLSRGASLLYLSAFPGEAEFCYPPLTFLKPTGKREVIEVEYTPESNSESVQKACLTVVEVEPMMA